jgi:aryl-alcohol dehydrogenase-like predicted oxidoreductase
MVERRNLLKGALAGAGALAGVAAGNARADAPSGGKVPLTGPPMAVLPADPADLLFVTDPGELRGEMLYRKLGTTGETVSAIGMGGAHLCRGDLKEEPAAIKMIHQAIDRGITFMDNCWDYNNGESERRAGIAFSQGGYRDKVFLMTKIDGRSKEAAAAQIDTSLSRFKTDHIDLLQHHEIIRFDDPDRVFAAEGAMEAVLAAKQAGKVRHIGFTGHKDPHVHLYMLEVAERNGFHFDSVQMPLNVMDAHFRSFAHLVLPYAVRQGIGVLGMKTLGDGVLLKSGATITPIEMQHYALNLPTSVVITGIDSQKVLDQAFQSAGSFRPMNRDQVAELLSRSRPYALKGEFELFKTTAHFDTTAKHADYLGPDTSRVQNLAPSTSG